MSRRSKLACLVASVLTLTATAPAIAVECDLINSLHNLQGALTLSKYNVETTESGSTQLRGKLVLGECEVSVVTMYTQPTSVTSDVGDAKTVRRISVHQNGANGRYNARFTIVAPELPGSTSPRSLVFQQMEFSRAMDGGQNPGKLVFSLDATGGSTGPATIWGLNASLYYDQYPYGEQQRVLASAQRSFNPNGTWNSPTQGFDVELSYGPSPDPMRPRLRVTVTPFGGQAQVQQLDLPMGMWPTDRAQGLLQQLNIPTGKTFTISNRGGG